MTNEPTADFHGPDGTIGKARVAVTEDRSGAGHRLMVTVRTFAGATYTIHLDGESDAVELAAALLDRLDESGTAAALRARHTPETQRDGAGIRYRHRTTSER